MAAFRFGFRVRGHAAGRRVLVDAARAFHGYAACEPEAECGREAYLSAFQFNEALRSHLDTHRSERGFVGPCFAAFVWFDIDRADPQAALTDTRRLTASVLERYRTV